VIQKTPTTGLNSVTYYALGAIFVVPLLIGVFLVGTNVERTEKANQVSRDLASMYAQGVDFSSPANQKIAIRVADGVGLNLGGGQGVVILSKIRVVREADCASIPLSKCGNSGRSVITQRYVIGNPALGTSSLGSPSKIDAKTGDVLNWATDATARAQDFSLAANETEYTYAAECYLPAADSRTGVYSRAMF